MDYSTLSRRSVKALTGLSLGELKKITQPFSTVWHTINACKNPSRPGRPLDHDLQSILVFVLVYLKTNLTYDALAAMFGVSSSTYHNLVQRGLRVLALTLEESGHAPARDSDTVMQFIVMLKGQRKVFIDATERRIRRPKNNQKTFYSGKKKCHTVKNQIICDKNKRVIYVSQTVEGKKSDIRLFEEQKLSQLIPETIKCYVDLGYQGIAKICPESSFRIPFKKPKGGELTQTQKNINRQYSSQRVVVENSIGGIKRMNAVGGLCRSMSTALRDLKFLVSAGLWNFHLAG